MKRYEIRNKHTDALYAQLNFDEFTETGTIDILNVDAGTGMYLTLLYQRGITHLDNQKTLRWALERVCPATRIGVGLILKSLGLDHYNELLLAVTLGSSVIDDEVVVPGR